MFVYVLRSKKDGRRYVGMSRNVKDRLEQHNRGEVRSTRARIPFELRYTEEANTRREARVREEYFKTAAGRRYLDRLGV